MEREIGETFEFEGKTYKVIESKINLCTSCAFGDVCGGRTMIVTGNCISTNRFDKKNVIFKEVKNMEIKDNKLTINIPDGMKIDIKNSDLKTGVIEFKKDNITLVDIYENKTGIQFATNSIYAASTNPYCTKLYNIATLIDIANYYNKDWKPNWNNDMEAKYYISYNNICNCYTIDYSLNCKDTFVYFKNKEDAQEVIDSPNFREILDAIFKN